MSLADRVMRFKKRSGITTKQLSKRSGISVSTLENIERGVTDNPTLRTICQLAQGLDIPVSLLVDDIEYPLLHPEALRIATEITLLLRKNN